MVFITLMVDMIDISNTVEIGLIVTMTVMTVMVKMV